MATSGEFSLLGERCTWKRDFNFAIFKYRFFFKKSPTADL